VDLSRHDSSRNVKMEDDVGEVDNAREYNTDGNTFFGFNQWSIDEKQDMMESIQYLLKISDSIDWKAMHEDFALQYSMDGMTDVHGYYEDYLTEIQDLVTDEINKELIDNGKYYGVVQFRPNNAIDGELNGVKNRILGSNNPIDIDRKGNKRVLQTRILKGRHFKSISSRAKGKKLTKTSKIGKGQKSKSIGLKQTYNSVKSKKSKDIGRSSKKIKTKQSKKCEKIEHKSEKNKAGGSMKNKSDESQGGKSIKYMSKGGKSSKYSSDNSMGTKSIKYEKRRKGGKATKYKKNNSSGRKLIDCDIESLSPPSPSGLKLVSLTPSHSESNIKPSRVTSESPSNIPSKKPTFPSSNEPTFLPSSPEVLSEVPSSQATRLDIYKYDSGSCPSAGALGVPCAEKLNLRRVCDKYDDLGSFRTCWEVCKPSFCCIHDADPDLNPTAASCKEDENCAQYAYCYIVWWKFHDTIGPAIYLRLEQDDDFFDVESAEVRDNETAWNDPIEKPFYDQLFKHHWDDISYVIENSTGESDGSFDHHAVFNDQSFWDQVI